MLAVKNILVGTDFGEESETALAYGRALAHQFGARLHVLHAVEHVMVDAANAGGYVMVIPDVQAALDDAEREHLESVISPDDRDVLDAVAALRKFDSPAHAIVEYARTEKIDLIVVGTRGRKGLSHMVLGSVAEKVVRTAPCPVLTVHTPEREFLADDALVAAPATTA